MIAFIAIISALYKTQILVCYRVYYGELALEHKDCVEHCVGNIADDTVFGEAWGTIRLTEILRCDGGYSVKTLA